MGCPCSGSTPAPAAAKKPAGNRRAAVAAPAVGPLGQPGYTWNGPQGRKTEPAA